MKGIPTLAVVSNPNSLRNILCNTRKRPNHHVPKPLFEPQQLASAMLVALKLLEPKWLWMGSVGPKQYDT